MNHSTITVEQQAAVAATLAVMPNIPAGVGSRENACSIAAINLALTGNLTDEIPDCMSLVIGKWIIKIQDSAPAKLRNSERWRRLLPLAAGTGRGREAERASVAMDWMWSVVLPQLQPLADRHGFGELWRKMCDLRTANAAAATNANAAAVAYVAASATNANAAAAANAASAATYAANANANAANAANAACAAAAVAYVAACANAASVAYIAASATNANAATYAANAANANANAAACANVANAATYAANAANANANAAAYAAANADFWHSVDPYGCLERMINLPEGDRK